MRSLGFLGFFGLLRFLGIHLLITNYHPAPREGRGIPFTPPASPWRWPMAVAHHKYNKVAGLITNYKHMFGKLKYMKDLRSRAKIMQNALAQESVTVEKGGVKVMMNGNMEITFLSVNEGLAKESLEGMLISCLNEAIKKTQRLMAQKMQEMGGLPGLG